MEGALSDSSSRLGAPGGVLSRQSPLGRFIAHTGHETTDVSVVARDAKSWVACVRRHTRPEVADIFDGLTYHQILKYFSGLFQMITFRYQQKVHKE